MAEASPDTRGRLQTQPRTASQIRTRHIGTQRIGVLDAFRGVAVLWVLAYHFLYFWTPAGRGYDLLPYGDALADAPLADVGYLGVTLFFLISGYVISMTLTKTPSLAAFAVKRIARLWPAIIFCGALTVIAAHAFGPPQLRVGVGEFLFSIVFLPPERAGKLFGQGGWQWVDGAYWSLWVEVRFYAIIGVLFFMFRRWWLALWLAFELAGWALSVAAAASGIAMFELGASLAFAPYTPYFTLGILAYRLHAGALDRTGLLALVLALAHALYIAARAYGPSPDTSVLVGYAIVFGLFGAFAVAPRLLVFLELKPLLAVGRWSYSLYLLHQVLGISLMALYVRIFGDTGPFPMLPMTLIALLTLSKFIFHRIERPMNSWLVARLLPLTPKHAERSRVPAMAMRGPFSLARRA